MDMTLPPSMEAYTPPDSLWRLVEENVAPGERQEIRDVLGNSMVEQSLELHTEVEALLEIWRDFRQESETALPPAKALPEPPLLRKSLKGQIRILVESLKERAKEEGRDSGLSLSRRSSEVLDYVLDDSPRECSTPPGLRRPSTAVSNRDGRETPLRMTPSSDGDELSATSTLSDRVDSVRDQLTYLEIDEVVQELRSALEDEVSQLLRDISFLQSCLEEESDFRTSSRMVVQQQEPSIQELRKEKSLLEKQLEEASSMTTINLINSVQPKTAAKPTSPKKLPGPLVPSSKSSSKLRPSPPSSASNGARQGPFKASQPVGKVGTVLGSSNVSQEKKATINPPSSAVRSKPPRQGSAGSSHNLASRTAPSATHNPSLSPPPNLQPSPPSSAKPPSGRPSSAQRFRTRVLEARQGKT
ncbi:coiled-coil domain-containing protein 24-like [Acanthaster planci]|uniref:Coiled-coil domain-containing protein 24-like n=1 Tax=Acanthaster planci TaxID=133434 RepID=A0A8B7ZS04_ACAPL|nr:coiled-coil domain-containing protein 24-like [Acanthaster planci]